MRIPTPRPNRRSRLSTAIAALVGLIGALLVTAVHAPAAFAVPPANTGNSLRVLSYNTAFTSIALPGVCGSIDLNDGSFGGMDYSQRAHAIAESIKATDNDVVVLSEVFSDAVKSQLVTELAPSYPNYVRKIGKPQSIEIANALLTILLGPVSLPCQKFLGLAPTTTLTSGDSGLMIFARNGLSFAPFNAQANPPHDASTVSGMNNGNLWGGVGQVAVDTYEFSPDLGILEEGECFGSDCFASKAAVMVKVRNNTTNQIHNIAFSHTQAWNNAQQVKTREAQFKTIKDLFLKSLTPAEAMSQPVYLTGDLNVPGQNKAKNSAKSEWSRIFNSSASSSGPFFACGSGPCTFSTSNTKGSLLTDSWGFETSVEDKGITNASDNARLDYFLDNYKVASAAGTPRFCLQHVMRAYDLEKAAGGTQLSDHLGIRADVNGRAPQCSPDDSAGAFGPKPILLNSSGNFGSSGTISFPGSVQWYKLDKNTGWGTGSYVFDGTSSKFEVGMDVYQADDLSKPIPMFNEQPLPRGVKFVLPDPPYYVKVYARNPSTHKPDRTVSGAYIFSVHENRGLNPTDAIGLRPAFEARYPWPAIPLNQNSAQKDNVTFSPDTEVWNEFYTDTTSAGAFPDVSLLNENSEGIDNGIANPPYSLKLRADAPNQPVIATQLDQNDGVKDPNQFHDWDYDGNHDYRLDAPDLPGTGSGPKKYFLTLKRNTTAEFTDIDSITTFLTPMTYLKSLNIYVWNDTPGGGNDETSFQYAYDGKGTKSCQTVTGAFCFGPVSLEDGETWSPTNSSFHGRFATVTTMGAWEDTDRLAGQSVNYIDHLNKTEQDVVKSKFTWGNAGNVDDSDYWYVLTHCRAHERGWADSCQLTD